MNAEFHYYTVFYLAREAGFSTDEAYVLAYSSEYLDNAIVSYTVDTDQGKYETLVTHHFGFWDMSQEWDVWIPFHFFPIGTQDHPSLRADAKHSPLDVRPNSNLAKQMLISALKSRDLYRVGIALHTYADTWAHQNFTGRNEEWNRIDRNSPIPPIGHAQAKRDPDDLDANWSDSRLRPGAPPVSNRERFLSAAGRIYRYLATFNRRSFADEELVLDRLGMIYGPPGKKARPERLDDFIIECGMERYRRTEWRQAAFRTDNSAWSAISDLDGVESTLDKLNWLKDELLHKTKVVRKQPVTGRDSFYSSHLYQWDQAARGQLKANNALLAPLRSRRNS